MTDAVQFASPTAAKLDAEIKSGAGSPEGVVQANPGAAYEDSTGHLWWKAVGTGLTGWVRTRPIGVYSPEQFGGKPDRVTNNTVPINQAKAAAAAEAAVFGIPTGIVGLCPGHYMTAGPHDSGSSHVIFRGCGQYVTVVQSIANNPNDLFRMASQASAVEDLTIDGNRFNNCTGDAIVLDAPYTAVRRVFVLEAGNNAVIAGKTASAIGYVVTDGKVRMAANWGIFAVGGSGSTDGALSDLDIGQCGKSGVRFDTGSQLCTNVHSWGNGLEDGLGTNDAHGFYLNSDGNQLVNCEGESNNGRGAYVHGAKNTLLGGLYWGNYINGVYGFASAAGASHTTITGARLFNNGVGNTSGTSSSAWAAILNDGNTNWTVGNNEMYDDGAAIPAGSYGSYVPSFAYPGRAAIVTQSKHYTEGSGSDWNNITGNTMRATQSRNGVSHVLAGFNSVFENNTGASAPAVLASAATIAVMPDGDVSTVSGTNTISTINGGRPNRVVTLIFQAAATVQAGTGLMLAGGANFVATADDTLTLCHDGTKWREVGRVVI